MEKVDPNENQGPYFKQNQSDDRNAEGKEKSCWSPKTRKLVLTSRLSFEPVVLNKQLPLFLLENVGNLSMSPGLY